jgi:hypothetical protein
MLQEAPFTACQCDERFAPKRYNRGCDLGGNKDNRRYKRRPSAETVAREFPFNAWRAIAEEFAAEFGGSWNGSHPLVALSWQSIVS